jgi:hypothetical protein
LHCRWHYVCVYQLNICILWIYRLYILVIQTIWDCCGLGPSSGFWESDCWLCECSFSI